MHADYDVINGNGLNMATIKPIEGKSVGAVIFPGGSGLLKQSMAGTSDTVWTGHCRLVLGGKRVARK